MPIYTYTTLDDPLATNGTVAYGINGTGQIVGTYNDASLSHPFLYSAGTYTTLPDDPSATAGTQPTGINDAGQIVGNYGVVLAGHGVADHGFLYSGGTYTTIDWVRWAWIGSWADLPPILRAHRAHPWATRVRPPNSRKRWRALVVAAAQPTA